MSSFKCSANLENEREMEERKANKSCQSGSFNYLMQLYMRTSLLDSIEWEEEGNMISGLE